MANPLLDYQQEVDIEPGLLGRLGHVGMSGVAAVGNILDVPGSVVRDTLAGTNPLDQLLPWNWASSENRTSGRGLLRKYGLVGPSDTYGSWWGGFAAEVLLDPLTYVGAGALLKGGQAASAGSKGLLRAGIPFTKHGVEVGTGKLAESTANALGKAASYAGKTYPVRAARQLFDVTAGGVTDELGQKISGQLYDAKKASEIDLRARTSEVKKDIDEMYAQFDAMWGSDVAADAAKQLDAATPNVGAATIDMAGPNIKPPQLADETLERIDQPTFGEMPPTATSAARQKISSDLSKSVFNRLLGFVADTGSVEDAIQQVSLPLDKMTPEFGKRVLKLVDTLRDATGKSWEKHLEMGGKGAKLEELAEGFTPKSVSLTESYKQMADDVLNTKNKELDDYLSGADPTAPDYDSKMIEAQLVQSELRRRAAGGVAMTPEMEKANAIQHFPRYASGFGALPDMVRRLFTNPGSGFARADELRHLPRDVVNKIATDPAARGKDAVKHIEETYGRHLGRGSSGQLDEAGNAIPRWGSKTEHATALADWAKKHSQFPVFNNTILDDWYRYEHQVTTANLTLETIHRLLADTISPAVESLAKGVPVPAGAGGYINLNDVFTKAAKMDAQAGSKYLAKELSQKLGKQIDPADVLKMQVPEEVANAIAGVKRVHDEPEWFGTIGRAVDTFNDFFKQNVTIPFPSFMTRNLTGGQFINLTTGYVNSPQDIADYYRAFKDTFQTLRNLDENALSEMFVEGVINPTMLSEGVDLASGAPKVYRDFRHPLDIRHSYSEVAGEIADAPSQFANPILNNVTDAARQGYGTWMRTGEKLSGAVEFMNRATMFTYLKRKGWTPRAAADKVAELQIDYSKATPFERNVMKRLVPFYCVPDNSLILTRDGWRSCYELFDGEEVLTHNTETGMLEWQPCEAVNTFEFDDELLVFENHKHQFRFTPNHRWLVERRRKGMDNAIEFVDGIDLNQSHSFIMASPLTPGGDSILSVDDARLLGWLVTDGHVRQRGNHIEAVLCQHHGKFLEEVIAVAGNPPRDKAHPNGTHYVTVEPERKARILPFLDKDRLPSIVTKLSREAAEAMYDAMYKADGAVTDSRSSDFFACQRSRGVREAFRILALMLGKRTKGNNRGLHISHNPRIAVKSGTIHRQPFRGVVWCPTTKNGTWVMKQGEVITITGNSWHRGVAPIILGTLARNPAGPLGQVVRASRLASSDDPTMPEWLGDTLAIENPLGSSEPGGRSYITGLGLPHESTLGFFGGGLRGFGREALSQLNPLVKAPLEWSTGTSFFQSGPGGGGRPLDEMNPPIGQTLANVARFAGRDPSTPVPTPDLLEFAVSNSPLTRYVTTARQLTDPRKHPLSMAANLLTGVRATDVSPQAQDAILRGRANELIRQIGGRRFTSSYFPKDMPPQNQELAASLKNLLNELAARGRARREAEEMAAQ